MKRIYYAGDSLLTGDRIADAVLSYAAALANVMRADTVDVPERDGSGAVTRTRLLIGPASQLVAVPETDSRDELTDDGLVIDIERRIASLGRPRVTPLTEEDIREREPEGGLPEGFDP
ncbi:hypothetical protein GCM10027416_25900 [Okibacterium endophyticum]